MKNAITQTDRSSDGGTPAMQVTAIALMIATDITNVRDWSGVEILKTLRSRSRARRPMATAL